MINAMTGLFAALAIQGAPPFDPPRGPNPPGGACGGITLSVNDGGSGIYDPASPASEPIRITVRAANAPLEAECASVPVAIRATGGPGAGQFPLRLSGTSDRLQARAQYVNASQAGNRLELTAQARSRLAAGESVEVDLGEILAGQYAAPGSYTAEIEVAAGDSVAPFTVTKTVIPSMRFVNERGGPVPLDLGDPTRGPQTASDQFMFRTNTSLSFRLHSDNDGRLVHESGDGLSSVPYTVTLNGRPVQLGGADITMNYTAGQGVRTGRLQVDVAHTDSLYAGRYRDTLVMSVTPY